MQGEKYQQKSKSISSAAPNYFVHFAMRHQCNMGGLFLGTKRFVSQDRKLKFSVSLWLWLITSFLIFRAVHNKTESHLCSFCGKNFNMKKNLRAHIAAIHERKEYPCPVPGCGEIFQSAFLMKAHNNLKHAGVKFECTSCKMEFKVSNFIDQAQNR